MSTVNGMMGMRMELQQSKRGGLFVERDLAKGAVSMQWGVIKNLEFECLIDREGSMMWH
jgi:hypothetical protein